MLSKFKVFEKKEKATDMRPKKVFLHQILLYFIGAINQHSIYLCMPSLWACVQCLSCLCCLIPLLNCKDSSSALRAGPLG